MTCASSPVSIRWRALARPTHGRSEMRGNGQRPAKLAIHVRVDPQMYATVAAYAADHNITMAEAVRTMLTWAADELEE